LVRVAAWPGWVRRELFRSCPEQVERRARARRQRVARRRRCSGEGATVATRQHRRWYQVLADEHGTQVWAGSGRREWFNPSRGAPERSSKRRHSPLVEAHAGDGGQTFVGTAPGLAADRGIRLTPGAGTVGVHGFNQNGPDGAGPSSSRDETPGCEVRATPGHREGPTGSGPVGCRAEPVRDGGAHLGTRSTPPFRGVKSIEAPGCRREEPRHKGLAPPGRRARNKPSSLRRGLHDGNVLGSETGIRSTARSFRCFYVPLFSAPHVFHSRALFLLLLFFFFYKYFLPSFHDIFCVGSSNTC